MATERAMGKGIVLYPLAAMGHLNPMVELGRLFLRQGLPVTVLIHKSPSFNNKPIDAYLSAISVAEPSLSFLHLPPSADPSDSFLDHFRLSLPHLRAHLSSSPPLAVVLDLFFDDALAVVAGLGLPCYFFFASNASNLAAFLHLPALHHQSTASFKDLGSSPVHLPGFPGPIPASDMPARISDRSSEQYKAAIVQFERLARSAGIFVNSFAFLEPEALRELSGCVAPVHCVGPITAGPGVGDDHDCLRWLDGQPRGSVVFLCFGSMGEGFSEEQVREVAIGLERSGQRFLWVVPKNGWLPEGFSERIGERGLVVRSWAPQRAVLRHSSTGGFVTHCGWNSVLESIEAGVGMIAWPQYAEQRMNKVFLVDGAGLAAEMRGYKDGLVGASEVEARVRWLMESEEGEAMRARAATVGEMGRAALREGGSSFEAVLEIIRLVTGHHGFDSTVA